MTVSLQPRHLLFGSTLAAVSWLAACSEREPVAPEPVSARFAKGGGKPVKVSAVIPPEGEQGQTVFGLIVEGSGFDDGSQIAFHLPGEDVPDPLITVGPVSFIDEGQLQADVTIDAVAAVALRDVSVQSARGPKGVGIEKFRVNDDISSVFATLTDPSSGPGIYSDDPATGFADYGPDDETTLRVQIDPQCDSPNGRRDLFLVLPALPRGTSLDQAEVDQVTCRPEGWLFLHLPDLLTIQEDCGELLGLGACLFEKKPAMKQKKNGTWRPAGGFGPTANYFVSIDGLKELYNFVWQDASVTVTKVNGAVVEWHVTASMANLYNQDHSSPDDTIEEDLPLALDIRVVPGP